MPARRPISLHAFAWGYAGWGNHTPALVDLVDRVEAARGFAPPLFVDVRIRRQVRAAGFRDRAFEELLGDRYLWLRGLGNRRIVDPSLTEHVLDDPGDIDRLLDAIRARRDRRVIYFCSCPSPEARTTCHRALVTATLVRAARRAGLPLVVEEWPGGAPRTLSAMSLPAAHDRTLRALARTGGTGRLPLPAALALVDAGALPHFSIVDQGDYAVTTGPAIKTARGWMLPVHEVRATVRP